MANTVIQLKHSTLTGNVPSSLANGEISINSRDGKFFYSTPAGVVVTHYPYPGPAGLNQEVQFNDSGVLGSDSGLTYNKTTDVITVVGGAIVGGVNVTPQIQLAFTQANTPSHVANSAASYANSGFTQANSNYTSAVTKLDVTNSGSSAYLIDQYTGNNPSIYVSGGETIAFNLNVSGHPFVIRESSGGANTSTGLTHVSTTGVVSTGASAQGYVTGVLYWKIPFSLVGSTYVYQCTIHGGMVGNIVIQQPASFVAANTTLAFIAANTPSHTANSAASYANGAFAAANSASGAASAGSYANSAFTTANSSGSYANSAFLQANTPSHVANSAASYANSAFSTANTTITVGSYANSAFTLANSANIIAQGAYNFANTISGGSAIDNVARASANSAGSYANSAFIHANSAFAVANTGGVTIGDVLALSIALG